MNGETKRHIDAARQVLVGVVPNPTSQIDQITNALIYKFMDDMDQAAIKAGGKPSFFVGDLEKYAWTRLINTTIGNQERMNLYAEGFIKLSESKKIPELFRSILKLASWPYRSPEVLDLFLREINYFDYSHPEELGNAYEYLLSIMSSQGDAGQFRTPRHIIDFIVAAVNPTKDEKILDPACGTAGFLISAYRHILSQHDIFKGKEKPLTPDQKRNLMSNFEGYDIDSGMVRISQVNMYLHQFKDPKIFQYDSLSSDERWGDKFDVILANPPFMSPKGGIRPHSKFAIQSSRSEVLFVDYIMSHLRPKGRAGVIVPEGIIFKTDTACKQLRKNLIEDGLSAVVSLPSGVFNPYAGVKTSILFFDNDQARKKDEILFVKVSNDGFDLGATKRPIDKNDLPEALEILHKWYNGEKSASKIVSYVSREKIAEGGEYNLSADRYGALIDYSNVKWQVFKLKDLENLGDITLGRGNVISKNDLNSNPGIYPVYSSSAQGNGEFGQYGDYMFDEELITWSVDGGGRFFYRPRHKFSVTNVSGWLRINNSEKIYIKYLYWILSTEWEKKSFDYVAKAHPSVIREVYDIPLPPLEIQKQIVEELDGYQKIISGAQQIVDSWKPRIDIDPKWEKVKLGEVVDFSQGVQVDLEDQLMAPKSDYEKFLRIENYTQNSLDFRYIPKKMGREKFVDKEDVVVVRYGASAGFIGRGFDGILANNLFLVNPNKDKLGKDYLYYYLNCDLSQEYLKKSMAGGAMPALSFGIVKNLDIFIPPKEIQKAVVSSIISEKLLVESNRKLIDIYEQKIKEIVAKLWEK
jgi:type I restriction enzyme M protein